MPGKDSRIGRQPVRDRSRSVKDEMAVPVGTAKLLCVFALVIQVLNHGGMLDVYPDVIDKGDQ